MRAISPCRTISWRKQDSSSALTIDFQRADQNGHIRCNSVAGCYTKFIKVAEFLLHVHNTGFIHNDIKGNNVVLHNLNVIKNNPI